MPRLLALLLVLLLVPTSVAHAGPTAEKRDLAAVYLYGFDLDAPDPGLVVMGVIGPKGLNCRYVQAGETGGMFAADVFCEGAKKARKGAKVKLVMLSGLEGDEQAADRCTDTRKLRKGGVVLSCEVQVPILDANAEALRSGQPLPGWAKRIVR